MLKGMQQRGHERCNVRTRLGCGLYLENVVRT